jgi:hypothetical protein
MEISEVIQRNVAADVGANSSAFEFPLTVRTLKKDGTFRCEVLHTVHVEVKFWDLDRNVVRDVTLRTMKINI